MKSLRCLSSFCFALLSFWIVGQEITIVDEFTNEALEGVAIYNKNKTLGTITNSKGVANLSIFPLGETVYIQFYGFKIESMKISLKELSQNFRFPIQAENETLDEVILSVARNATKRSKIAEKVNIISVKDISNRRPTSGAELVGLSPGIRIQKSQGGGGSPVIRGFEANRLLLVVDGVRLNNAIFRSGHLQNSLTIHPNMIERVEVIYGSSSVGYGSDALGGVVHYYTKNPLINNEKKIRTQLSSDFSTANNSYINSISTELSFKKWASLTSLSYSDFGDIRMGRNRTHGFENWGLNFLYSLNNRNTYTPDPVINLNPSIQKNTDYNQIDLLQKFLFKLNAENQLVVNFQYSNSSDIPRYDKLVENRNGFLRYAEWYYGPQKRLLFSPQLKIFPRKKLLNSGKVTIAIQNFEESRISRTFNSLTRITKNEKVNSLSVNGDFEFKIDKKHAFAYGFEGVYNDVNSFASKKDLIIEENVITGFTPALPFPTRYPSKGSSYRSYAVYINWVWDLNTQLTLNAGLRLTDTSLQGEWKEYYNINALLSSVKLNSEALTQTLSLIYRPSIKTKWKAIISNGFRNPNIDDVGKIRENRGYLIVPNPMLLPEYAYNFELGLTKYLNKEKNYISIQGFTTLISRHIGRNNYPIFSDQTTSSNNTVLYNGEELITLANNNLGNRYMLGTSLDGNIFFTDKISLKGDFNIINALKNDQYGPLPSISPVFINLFINYEKKKWFASLRYQYSGSKNPEEYSLGGEDGLEETPIISESQGIYAGTPAWSELSFLTQFSLNENGKITIGLENIFDVHYRSFASGVSAPGRNLRLGLNLKF